MDIVVSCKCLFVITDECRNVPGHVITRVRKRAARCHHQDGDTGLIKMIRGYKPADEENWS